MIWRMTSLPRISGVMPTHGAAMQVAYATGDVEARASYTLAPKISATVVRFYADENDWVKAGQVLAELDATEINAQILAQREQATFAEKTLDRLRLANQNLPGTVSPMEMDRALSEWKSAIANLAKLMAQKNYGVLRAVKNGRVVRREGEEGQLAIANQSMFWVATDSRLRVSARIDEEDIGLIQAGQKVHITNTAFPSQVFIGEVDRVTPLGDSQTRSFRLRINLPDNTPFLLGMTAEVNVITQEKPSALLIPRTAIDGDTAWVWSPEARKFTPTKVRLGIVSAKKVEVLEGLNDTMTVAENASVAKRFDGQARLP